MSPGGEHSSSPPLLGLASGADVHDHQITIVADPVLGARLRIHLVVDDRKPAVKLEDDLAEAARIAGAVGARICRVDADDLTTVHDVHEHAVLMEAAGAVLDGRVAAECDGCDVGIPLHGDRFKRAAAFLDVAAVDYGTLGGAEHFVAVSGSDVDQSTVAVANQCLEIVVLATRLPAVRSNNRVSALGERHLRVLRQPGVPVGGSLDGLDRS